MLKNSHEFTKKSTNFYFYFDNLLCLFSWVHFSQRSFHQTKASVIISDECLCFFDLFANSMYIIFTYLYILGENMENAFIYCITNIWFNRAMDCQIIGFSIGFSIFCPWYDSLQSCLEIYFHLNGTWSCMYFFFVLVLFNIWNAKVTAT